MVLSIELQFRCGRVLLEGAPRAFKVAIVLLEVNKGYHDYSCKVESVHTKVYFQVCIIIVIPAT